MSIATKAAAEQRTDTVAPAMEREALAESTARPLARPPRAAAPRVGVDIERVSEAAAGSSVKRLWLIDLAGLLYAIAMHKFAVRDPLSTSTGIQGVIEIVGMAGALGCVALATLRCRRRFGPSWAAICLGIFGLFALAGSWRSYDPALSFVKGSLLLGVLATGYLACQAGVGRRYLRAIFWSYLALLVIGLAVGFLFPHKYPLWWVDAYSGRTRISVFSTFPGTMGECAALLVLLAPLIKPRPGWVAIGFLIVMNIMAGGKTATAGLFLILLVQFLWRIRRWRSWGTVALIAGAMAVVLLAADFTLVGAEHSGGPVAKVTGVLYGHDVVSEAMSLDGRAKIWGAAVDLVRDSKLLGFGVDGARAEFLRVAFWAGQSHNGFIEAALESGVLGALFFLAGLAGVARACFRAPAAFRLTTLSVVGYMVLIAFEGIIFNAPVDFGLLLLICLLYEAKAAGRTWMAEEPS